MLARAADADVVVMAAAVADFRPKVAAGSKLHKSDGVPDLVLEATTDILAELGRRRRRRPGAGRVRRRDRRRARAGPGQAGGQGRRPDGGQRRLGPRCRVRPRHERGHRLRRRRDGDRRSRCRPRTRWPTPCSTGSSRCWRPGLPQPARLAPRVAWCAGPGDRRGAGTAAATTGPGPPPAAPPVVPTVGADPRARRPRQPRMEPPVSSRYTFTSESVTEGHPDKMADQISDSRARRAAGRRPGQPGGLRDAAHHRPGAGGRGDHHLDLRRHPQAGPPDGARHRVRRRRLRHRRQHLRRDRRRSTSSRPTSARASTRRSRCGPAPAARTSSTPRAPATRG